MGTVVFLYTPNKKKNNNRSDKIHYHKLIQVLAISFNVKVHRSDTIVVWGYDHIVRWWETPGEKSSSSQQLYFQFVPGSYSLSVRDLDHNTGEGVKHYRIRNMDNGGFYITAKISFNSLKELVDHHSRMYNFLNS